jgi:hypothetical protein
MAAAAKAAVSNRNLRREREWDMIARKLLLKVDAHEGASPRLRQPGED